MLKSILVFFDGSAASRKAFDLGLDMAMTYHAKMVIVSVMPAIEAEAMLERQQDYPVEELRGLCLEAGDKGVQCRYRTDIGDPSEQIVRAAKDHRADLIIMGQCRIAPEQFARFDPRVETILRDARCPVTMIN